MGRFHFQRFWGAIGEVKDHGEHAITIQGPQGLEVVTQRRLTKLTPPGPPAGSRFIKYIAFYEKKAQLRAMQVESRAVDCVPYDPIAKAFYLIKRKDSGLLALPGGFIDPEDGNPNTDIVGMLKTAALRELQEETGAVPDSVVMLGHSVREVIAPGTQQVTREWITRTWPFAALMPMTDLKPADDAQQAPGTPGLLPGWYASSNGVPDGLHFAHHATILTRLFKLARQQFPPPGTGGRRFLQTGMALAARLKLAASMGQVIRRDYDLIAKGKDPICEAGDGFTGFDWLGFSALLT